MDSRLEEYAENVATTPRDSALEELHARTVTELGHAPMLSGPLVGRLLETLVAVSGATRVLEIGTFSGVSALEMAAGLPEGGRIVTCEADAEHADFARRAFAEHPLGNRIELREGPAMDTLATLPGPFDFVFVDADKTGYPAYVEAVLPKLVPQRGLIALDNMLMDGRVLEPGDSDGPRVIDELNRRARRPRRRGERAAAGARRRDAGAPRALRAARRPAWSAGGEGSGSGLRVTRMLHRSCPSSERYAFRTRIRGTCAAPSYV